MSTKLHELDFAKLRAFEIVARHGTLQIAAARLNLTVSAISTQIRRLEEIVGAKLFERTPSKLMITPEGERFAADATQLLDLAEKSLTKLQNQAGDAGHVTIGVGSDYAWLFMPKINAFSTRHSNITTTIRIHRATEALTALQKGNVDFSVGAFLRRPKGVRTKTFAHSTMSLVFKAHHAVNAAYPFGVISDRLIVAPRSATVRTMLVKSQKLQSAINFLECPTCHTAVDLVKRGSGPAIVHSLCLGQIPMGDMKAIDLGETFGVEQIVIAYKASTLKKPIMLDLLDWLLNP